MVDLEKLQKQIEETHYQDSPILDIQSHYFGDEAYIDIWKSNKEYWKISFLSCYKVNYETDEIENYRNNFPVNKMNSRQLGYFGQNIDIKEYEINKNFIEFKMDLVSVFMKIICREITIETKKRNNVTFFWEKNK